MTLIRSFEKIAPTLQPEILQMVETGLNDADPLVREATVESYSLLLEKIDDQALESRKRNDDPAEVALERILGLAISDPDEIVREAAVVALAVQKSSFVKSFSVSFLLDHIDDSRLRRACRSVTSLAEFSELQPMYLDALNDCLSSGDWRFRRSAVQATLRLAKLESLPSMLLPNVTRRLFDAEVKVSSAAALVIQTALNVIKREDVVTADFLTECLWLAKQADPKNHLQAVLETKLMRDNLEDVVRLCHDRIVWHLRNRSANQVDQSSASQHLPENLTLSASQLVRINGRSAIGWITGSLIRLTMD